MLDGLPTPAFLVIAAIALVMLFGDRAFAHQVTKRRKYLRHAGRIGGAMLIATVIFFFGNNHVQAPPLRHPAILALPVLAVLGLVGFHVASLFFTDRADAGALGSVGPHEDNM